MATYWIKRGEQIRGPFSGTNIRSLVDLGQVSSSDQISPNQSGPWQAIEKIPELSRKVKTETVTLQTSISLPPVQHAPPAITQPQYMAAPPQQPQYPVAPQQHSQHQAPVQQQPYYAAPPAPQVIYVQVPQASSQPVQIVNNVTSTNVNQNRNSARSGSGSENSAVSLGLLLLVGAVVCLAVDKPQIATYLSGAGMLACVIGALVSFTMWGRGLAASMLLFVCNMVAMGIASSQVFDKVNKATPPPQTTQTASHGVIDRCC